MDVVALVLSETGAADRAVRDRLAASSRIAAVQSGPAESPLWAANPNATRPYAVTQLAPGYSGAERLLDPLDGVIGNDQSAIEEVRRRLDGGGTQADSPAAGRRLWAAAIVIPLIVFVVAYSAGAAINSAAARPEPTSPKVPVPDAVQPTPLASKKVLLPGISKAGQVPLRSGSPAGIAGRVDERAVADAVGQARAAVRDAHPRARMAHEGARGVVVLDLSAALEAKRGTVVVAIAAHPCKGLAGCLADRTEFDARWSSGTASRHRPRRVTVRPGSARTPRRASPTEASLTRAFLSPATGSWWLVGVAVNADPASAGTAQAILNDIRTQTS